MSPFCESALNGTELYGRIRMKNQHLEGLVVNITEIQSRPPVLIQQLLDVWERAVNATQLFLSDQEIQKSQWYKEYIKRKCSYLCQC